MQQNTGRSGLRPHPAQAVQPGQALERAPQGAAIQLRARLYPQIAQHQRVFRPVAHALRPRAKGIALQNRQHIIAILALLGGGINLPTVGKAEQRLDQPAIPQKAVQRRDQLGARRQRGVQAFVQQRRAPSR